MDADIPTLTGQAILALHINVETLRGDDAPKGDRLAAARIFASRFQCIILQHSRLVRILMAADEASKMWVPVCCGRIMRCNMFRQADGAAYAALVCTLCNKNITLEQEPLAAANNLGEGSHVLSLIGSPKPPKTHRRRSSTEAGLDDPTL